MSWKIREIHQHKLPTAVLGLDVDESGDNLYAACLDGKVYRVDPDSGAHEELGSHSSYASGVKCTSNRETVVSAGYDGKLLWLKRGAKETIREVQAHGFWSWKLGASPDGNFVASVSGQYLCGGYKYEPRAAEEPTVKIFDALSGKLRRSFEMLPPVLSVAISPDNRYCAAGNLMGDVNVWDLETGESKASWNTPSFTGWGIIKGHYYTGGIYSLAFTPDGSELLAAGMGSTTDPAAGNGRQLWQRFAWREPKPRKVDETHPGESGQGLMETIAFRPGGDHFVMAGRIQKGKWNVAFFDARRGSLIGELSTKTRVTEVVYSPDGRRIYLAGAISQGGRQKSGTYRDFGRVGVYSLPSPPRQF